jgi:Domain of unknown function (DUF4383)
MQRAARFVGATFLLVGILGFVPGVTQQLGDISFAGHESEAELLGVFQVSILHNVVHLLFGVAGLAAARAFDTSRTFLVVGGIVYLALWLYGMAVERDSGANFVPMNTADNWLHFALGGGMVALGLTLAGRARSANRA